MRRNKRDETRISWEHLGVEVRTAGGWVLLPDGDAGGVRWTTVLLAAYPPCWCLGTGRGTDGAPCPKCPNGQMG